MTPLCKHTQFKYLEIWQPRYHDKKVLLAKFKVGQHNKVVFTKAPSMGTDPYYISGQTVKKYKLETNGSVQCYAVPVDEFVPLELAERCEHEYR
jgi:hypothetical protein